MRYQEALSQQLTKLKLKTGIMHFPRGGRIERGLVVLSLALLDPFFTGAFCPTMVCKKYIWAIRTSRPTESESSAKTSMGRRPRHFSKFDMSCQCVIDPDVGRHAKRCARYALKVSSKSVASDQSYHQTRVFVHHNLSTGVGDPLGILSGAARLGAPLGRLSGAAQLR